MSKCWVLVANEVESGRPLMLTIRKSVVTVARSQIASDGLKRGWSLKSTQ